MTQVTTESSVISQVMRISDENHWHAQFLWFADVPEQEVTIGDWIFRPIEMDDTEIPAHAVVRPPILTEAGINVRRVLVGHPITDEPSETEAEEERKEGLGSVINEIGILVFSGLIVLAVIAAVVAILASLALIVLGVLAMVGMAVGAIAALYALIGLDPVLVVIVETERQQLAWISVAEWND